ncbi:TPA: DUF1642 domain-containing protein [Enterococcus faecalis]|uniref:DUF1642 domain-containing protein n=1 Tax=Enterococcus TaxID=1350 RepID=UPI00032F4BEF|nr:MULTISPECIES: DUF1642 domain-containing protein [Enterococcus]EKC6709774.1 DUF1642 domain-containing protein [Enterococcus faecalis]EOE15300.1 hypothetical protein Q9U_01074 [Enterococcus faecalis EnGen0079]EOI15570.1 hypothetical protein UCO_00757 [Enterococcus faecalis EnGen0244]EOJ96511.1 hypothetical protein WOK_02685 [Enterococcus faecalis EnGen0359]EOL40106.1 hypothetical protein WMG_01110 [Enterococcus faecalis EnGen0348]
MNKQEMIEKWESKKGASAYKLIESPLALTKREIYVAGYGVARKEILDDLKQLDEPKKVVFSHEEKFVADWLDGLKGRISDKKLSSGAAFMVFVGQQLECLYYNEYTLITDDVEGWLLHPENKVKLLNAIDNGYEVEKEQLYYVFDTTTKQYLGVDKVLNKAFWLSSQNSGARTPLTEQEIKSIDERYWPFAVKVDGE